MERSDILAFARRDWGMVAEAKSEFWLTRKRGLSVADVLALGDELRQHARHVRPDWPSASDRNDDFAVHVRVAEALRAVSIRSR